MHCEGRKKEIDPPQATKNSRIEQEVTHDNDPEETTRNLLHLP